ncbi:hypothetical protein BZA77DRAFT_352906 [Pyronema omphalodes]|nr:hypothetical protein BZA77DRAFT_352906 [Pyronema omphalodes]
MSSSPDIFEYLNSCNFPKLTGENYFLWSKSMFFRLQELDGWSIITKIEPRPEAAPTSSSSSQTQLNNWNSRLERATAFIYQACTPAVQIFLNADMDGIEMWEVLSNAFDKSKTPRGRKLLFRDFQNSRPVQENGKEFTISDWVSGLLRIENQLKDSELQISDEMFICSSGRIIIAGMMAAGVLIVTPVPMKLRTAGVEIGTERDVAISMRDDTGTLVVVIGRRESRRWGVVAITVVDRVSCPAKKTGDKLSDLKR